MGIPSAKTGTRWLAAAAVAVALLGPWPLGWAERWQGSDWKTRADAATAKAVAHAKVTVGPCEAGFGRVSLAELCAGVPLAGYGNRAHTPNTGISDAPEVKALALRNGSSKLAIIAPDLLLTNKLLVDSTLAELAKRGRKWQREELYFTATHTHSSIGGYAGRSLETLGLGQYRERIATGIANKLADAICQAEDALQPAEWSTASVEAPASAIRNRTFAGDPVNRWVDGFRFRKPSGEALGTFVVFSAHATCRPTSDLTVSRDYPGLLCDELQSNLGGVCMFAAGGVGSMAPAGEVPRDRLAEFVAGRVANALAPALEKAEWRRDLPLGTVGYELPLPAPAAKLSPQWAASPAVASAFFPATAWLHGARVGNRVLLGAPADYNGPMASDLCGHGAAPAIVTSFNGDYIGYIVPKERFDLDSYEPRSMAFFGRDFAAVLQRQFVGLRDALAK